MVSRNKGSTRETEDDALVFECGSSETRKQTNQMDFHLHTLLTARTIIDKTQSSPKLTRLLRLEASGLCLRRKQAASVCVCVCEWVVREVSAPEFYRREPPLPPRNAVVFSLCSRSQLSDPIFSAAFKVRLQAEEHQF